MLRLARIGTVLLVVLVGVAACGDPGPSPVPVDAQGFPTDWPVAIPPGNVTDCANGTVSQEDDLFSVVMCLADEPDSFAAAEQYVAALEADGFVEREPGAFATEQVTFLDGNGIEIYLQLVDREATIVLIKPAA